MRLLEHPSPLPLRLGVPHFYLFQESRDKQFLLMRLNEVTGEAKHGMGSSKKGQLSKFAKDGEPDKTTSGEPPSYDSMGATKPN